VPARDVRAAAAPSFSFGGLGSSLAPPSITASELDLITSTLPPRHSSFSFGALPVRSSDSVSSHALPSSHAAAKPLYQSALTVDTESWPAFPVDSFGDSGSEEDDL
jgi:hypothetical protein